MLTKVDGVIIKTQDYGETHKIITIFSRKHGKFSAIARGAKKPKSRMAAVTQPFIYGEFFVYLTSGLGTLQQGEILDSFRSIREDIIKTAYVAYIMELTDKLIEPQKDKDGFLFEQLLKTMKWISEHEDLDVPIMMYELKLFKKGGFAPVLYKCVSCNRKEPPFFFSINEGGLLCSQCSSRDFQAIPLSNALVRLLHIFANVGIERVGSISVKQNNIDLLRKILDEYYDQYGGYFLKTKKFLNQLEKLK